MIRLATETDFEPLVHCAKLFTEESGLPLTFNEAHARDTLWTFLHHSLADFLVDDEDGVLAGAALVMYEQSYYDEVCAYVDKMFVHREFRGRGTSDALIKGIIAAAEKRGAKLIFSSATAGMGERVEKMYVRLFRRHGFHVLGRIIMRETQ